MDADGGAVLGIKIDLRGVEQGLGGDAAPIQAGAAHLAPFHDSGAQSQLGSLQSRRVSAGTGADDDQLIIRHSLCSSGSISNAFFSNQGAQILRHPVRFTGVYRPDGIAQRLLGEGTPFQLLGQGLGEIRV